MPKKSDLTNVKNLRRDARKNMELGAVTADYRADRAAVIDQLNQALATELVCVLRYRRHYFTARGSHAEYVAGATLRDMIREDLVAERVAINSYRDMIRYLGADDPTTSDMLKGILAVEEEHADELADLLEDFPHSE